MRIVLFLFFSILPLFLFGQKKNITLLDNWTDKSLEPSFDGESIFNECWGWTKDGQEYAVIGSTAGAHFFKITYNNKLKLVDFKQGKHYGNDIIHRDFHDCNGYLYEVSDEGSSSLRIYDLQYLPDSVHIIYDSDEFILRSHNIFIDTSSNLLYSCGNTSNTGMDAVRVISIADPYHPSLIYDYNFVSYVHDIFVRNDTAYINAPFDGLLVVDFSTPTMPIPLGALPHYIDQGYTHSGWLNQKGDIYVLCDENPANRFKVCNVEDVSNIEVLSATKPPTYNATFPHNVIIKDSLAYFSYYNDGLQIYDISTPNEPKRIAYYDTYDGDNTGMYRGAWGVYPLLPSGRILISDRKNGLFLFRHNIPPNINVSNNEFGIYPNPTYGNAYFYYNQPLNYAYTLTIYDDRGRLIETYESMEDYLKLNVSHYAKGTYYFQFYSPKNDKKLEGKFIKL